MSVYRSGSMVRARANGGLKVLVRLLLKQICVLDNLKAFWERIKKCLMRHKGVKSDRVKCLVWEGQSKQMNGGCDQHDDMGMSL